VKCANCQHEYVPLRQCASESPLYFCCEDCHWEFNEKYPNLAWCAHCHSPMSQLARSTKAVFYHGADKPATFFCTDKCYTAWLTENGKVECVVCHKETPYSPLSLGFCSDDCHMKWLLNYVSEDNKEPETKTISPVCPSCGGDANTRHGVWFNGLCFCNTSCKKAFEELHMDRCVRCGKGIPYAPFYYNDLTFCRAYCRDEYKKQHPSYCCAHCGKGFIPSSTSYVHLNGSHFCCHDCYAAYKRPPEKQSDALFDNCCKQCGIKYARVLYKQWYFCSNECIEKWRDADHQRKLIEAKAKGSIQYVNSQNQRWVTNDKNPYVKYEEIQRWCSSPDFVVGEPKATMMYSVEKLKEMGYVGIWQNPKEVITGNDLKVIIFD